MSDGYIIGGRGSSLNFKVIAVSSELLLPAAAKENTIAVITTVPITSYVFSATAPTAPAEGMVWFAVGTASTVGFNAIKRNGLWVYPTGCQQHISDAWTPKYMYIYLNGAWASLALPLYTSGTKNVDFSTSGRLSSFTQDGKTYSNAYQVIWESTQVRLTCAAAIGYGNGVAITTKNVIDLSPFSRLEVVVPVDSYCHLMGGTFGTSSGIVQFNTDGNITNATSWKGFSAKSISGLGYIAAGTYTLDISSINSGYVYVQVGGRANNASADLKISSIQLLA